MGLHSKPRPTSVDSFISPRPCPGSSQSPSPVRRACNSAVRRAQQLETFADMWQTKSASSEERLTNKLAQVPEASPAYSCRSSLPSSTSAQQHLMSSGESFVSLAEENNVLQRELRKSRRDHEHMQKTMKSFQNRFQVRRG